MQIMHAYLVTGSSKEKREDKTREILEKNKAGEVIRLQGDSHQISSIREINQKLSLRAPVARAVIVEEAQLLTQEAANSFLKTLEEPPRDTIIILTAPNADLVLETVSSRTEHIDLGGSIYQIDEETKKEAKDLLKKLIAGRVGERLKTAEEVSRDRKQALSFVIGQTFAARELLLNGQPAVDLLERLEQTRKDLEANVNVKLAISDLLLHYPTPYPTPEVE